MKDLKIALIGLDTSHAIEFPRRMQAPDCEPQYHVDGLRAVACMRFKTPFTNDAVLDERQKQLESWGIKVTASFEEAVADCDAVMIEINDPAYHWEYFQKCAALGKPVFLDKPLADDFAAGRKIADLAEARKIKVMSCSSLRFSQNLESACAAVPQPFQAYCYGPLGDAPAGESVVWYGVHSFEMMSRMMGRGALRVDARQDASGVVAIVEYPENRRGIVELTNDAYAYGGTLRDKNANQSYIVDGSMIYTEQLRIIRAFFQTGTAPVSMADSLEVIDLLDTAVRSCKAGRPVKMNQAE